MNKFMTIQNFSERTGVSKSALRFYETKNLLQAAGRNTNGYRVYSEDQIETVKLISSLRVAGVSIKDIQLYLKEGESSRNKIMDHWIQTIRKKVDILNVSLRYLDSRSIVHQIYLIEKPAETIIWFSAECEVGKFKEAFMKRGKELEKLSIPIKSCYLKYVSGKEVVKAQIGFGVPDTAANGFVEAAGLEQMDACICIALSFNEPVTDIQNGYRKLLNYASEHGWIPAGTILEWYRGVDFTEVDLLMPVTQLE
ncbi:MerR family transcriptional regulator [Lysinibacillus odysseyi]|uniref:HTH merR-type domain-containing protein n=2 Tax=Lysinibacillus odysseyi TaxID=202611 RepID=A0A0A3IRJ4_9BACI|nr:MerR family transcriptional regulator [Lysinibacillus odysseyi]KGR85503.1 hypothetical protein CD32_09825 [Lysinibacillus odysseyi 34hs-1 = NBRC 100172]